MSERVYVDLLHRIAVALERIAHALSPDALCGYCRHPLREHVGGTEMCTRDRCACTHVRPPS